MPGAALFTSGKLCTRTVGIVRLRQHYETRAQRIFLGHAMDAFSPAKKGKPRTPAMHPTT
jgi:hypothetical protein